jgi:hypothetical protein
MKWKIFFLLLVLLPFLALTKAYFHTGVPFTHDGENHLARFANYKVAIREGQWPPRFAPNLMNHYGYPVFNYNYPLLNILSLPLSFLGLSYELTFKLLMAVGLALGVWGVYQWLAVGGFSRAARLIGISAFLLAPFTINLIYVRGSIGELWAMALLPWLMWLTKRIKRQLPVSWLLSVPLITAFLLSHNISVLFGGGLWFLYTFFKFKRVWSLWRQWLAPLGLSIFLSLWFWLPALAEKQLVVLDKANLSSQFSRHFAEPLQLITSPLQFGYSFETAVDTMSLSVGLIGFASLVIMTLWLVRLKKSARKEFNWLWFFVIVGWLLLFLQTSFSYQIWRLLPLVAFIQFPWRLSLFFTVICLPLVATLFDRLKFTRSLLWLLVLLQLIAVWRFTPIDYLHKTQEEYDLFPQSTSTLNENLPKEFTYLLIGDWQPAPKALSGEMTAVVEHWTGSSRRYLLTVSQTALIVEPTMYFAGWQTKVNDQLIEYVDRTETEGRLGYRLEPGQYVVETRFTQATWPRLAGNSLSVLAFLVWGYLIWREKAHFSGKS